MMPIIQADAAKIGITFKVRSINGAYTTIQTPKKNIPISDRSSWGKDYADPYTFFAELFDCGAIIQTGNTNYSLVGLTPAIAKTVGATGSINERAERRHADHRVCSAKLGAGPHHVLGETDKKLMTPGRPVGSVPLAEQRVHHRPEGHALELRPVLGRPGLLVGVRSSSKRKRTRGGTRRPAPPLHRRH